MEYQSKAGKARQAGKRKQPEPTAPTPSGDGHEQVAQPGPEAEELRRATEATSPTPEKTAETDNLCPVVGIGASAGGLAAFERFCQAMPPEAETTIALVLVQHLDPDRKSLLTDLIRQYTHMKVEQVTDGMEVRPGWAYIIPPNKDMALLNGRLQLLEPSTPRGLRLPIDFFFRSLAQDRREKGIGVILSGAGTDGTLGLKAIKESGGLVIVQAPDTAQYDGMPRSAIGTGLADYVLAPEDMPGRLFAYIQRAFARPPQELEALERDARAKEPLQRIFLLLRSQAGHDFSRYKQNTIIRRIERRMAVHQIEALEGYVRYLQQNPAEVAVLFRELLIGVTNFFRDPEAFAVLQDRVIPTLFANKRTGEAVRVWVSGCSTGEEAYSIAMLLQEHMSKLKGDVRAQIFATDIDTEAIDQARAGVYPNSIAADVLPDRLARFFTEDGSTYHVKKAIRDMVVFAEQNVAEDPPFSRIDLVSCRNLLIYMNSELQRRVLPLFHYALNPMGYLFLGTSETVGEYSDLFSPIDRRWKVFVRKPGGITQRAPIDFARAMPPAEQAARPASRETRHEARQDVRQVMEQALLSQHTPAAVVTNAEGDVLYIHGRTGLYLEPAEGEASLNVLRMAREGLRLELTTSLRKAVATQAKIAHTDLSVRTNGGFQNVNLLVRPMIEAQVAGLYLVVFEPAPVRQRAEAGKEGIPSADKDERISALERELRSKEEYLQTTVEELETSNEELTSTNEELQSANEELQSTNEELETSKEELQSVNEELMTVNTELQKKIEELSRVNNDLNNLLASTGIGTVFVDNLLHIQRFTPAATEIINLIQTDVGRPVAHIVSNLQGYTDLIKDVTSVLDTLVPKERDVQARNGRWYLMRIQPYRTIENTIEGAVITFVEITNQKKLQAALEESQRIHIDSIFDPAVLLSGGGKVADGNEAAAALLGYGATEIREVRLSDLVEPEGYRRLREAIDEAQGGTRPELRVTMRRNGGETLFVRARLRKVYGDDAKTVMMVMQDARESGGDGTGS